jgi:cytochrome c1
MLRRPALETGAAILAAALAVGALVVLATHGGEENRRRRALAALLTGGDPDRGPEAMLRLGCGSCHTIPGVVGARGRLGPPLTHMGSRVFIAGVMPNTAANMIIWLRWPQGVLPKSGMPNMDLTEAESRDIAAYLFTLD